MSSKKSFVLLSSMTPDTNSKKKRNFQKKVSKLALKRNIHNLSLQYDNSFSNCAQRYSARHFSTEKHIVIDLTNSDSEDSYVTVSSGSRKSLEKENDIAELTNDFSKCSFNNLTSNIISRTSEVQNVSLENKNTIKDNSLITEDEYDRKDIVNNSLITDDSIDNRSISNKNNTSLIDKNIKTKTIIVDETDNEESVRNYSLIDKNIKTKTIIIDETDNEESVKIGIENKVIDETTDSEKSVDVNDSRTNKNATIKNNIEKNDFRKLVNSSTLLSPAKYSDIENWLKKANPEDDSRMSIFKTPKSRITQKTNETLDNETILNDSDQELLDSIYGDVWRSNKTKGFTERKSRKKSDLQHAEQSVAFSDFRPEFESTRTPVRNTKKNSQPVRLFKRSSFTTDSDCDENNSPTFYNTIMNSIPRNKFYRTKINSTRKKKPAKNNLSEKLKGICDSDNSDIENNHSSPVIKVSNCDLENAKIKKRLYTHTKLDENKFDSKLILPECSRISYSYLEEKNVNTKKPSKNVISGEINLDFKKQTPINKKLLTSDRRKIVAPYSAPSKPCSKPLRIKTPKNKPRYVFSSSESDTDLDSDDSIKRSMTKNRVLSKQVKPNRFNFVTSLSENITAPQCDPIASVFKTDFKNKKEELAKKLFDTFNSEVFELQIPSSTQIIWNNKLRKTAGYCRCKRIISKHCPEQKFCLIELSTKIIDKASRLRDTLIHEMCHAATWIINGQSDGHGRMWKSWAHKAMKCYPDIPPIERCHNYEINTKFIYKCVGCGYSIGRHSKSLDVTRKRCGYCYGKFELLVNMKAKNGETKTKKVDSAAQPKGFALYVKENYGDVKKTTFLKHGDIMKLLGQQFQELKIKEVS